MGENWGISNFGYFCVYNRSNLKLTSLKNHVLNRDLSFTNTVVELRKSLMVPVLLRSIENYVGWMVCGVRVYSEKVGDKLEDERISPEPRLYLYTEQYTEQDSISFHTNLDLSHLIYFNSLFFVHNKNNNNNINNNINNNNYNNSINTFPLLNHV